MVPDAFYGSADTAGTSRRRFYPCCTITAEQSKLTVEGRKADKGDHNFLFQGISMRPFRRVFNLADYVQVKNASFENGMLKIDLVREVPESMKPIAGTLVALIAAVRIWYAHGGHPQATV